VVLRRLDRGRAQRRARPRPPRARAGVTDSPRALLRPRGSRVTRGGAAPAASSPRRAGAGCRCPCGWPARREGVSIGTVSSAQKRQAAETERASAPPGLPISAMSACDTGAPSEARTVLALRCCVASTIGGAGCAFSAGVLPASLDPEGFARRRFNSRGVAGGCITQLNDRGRHHSQNGRCPGDGLHLAGCGPLRAGGGWKYLTAGEEDRNPPPDVGENVGDRPGKRSGTQRNQDVGP
jgi:hypothetical protein